MFSFEGSLVENMLFELLLLIIREICVFFLFNDRWMNLGWIKVDLLVVFNWWFVELFLFVVFISEINCVRYGVLSYILLVFGFI